MSQNPQQNGEKGPDRAPEKGDGGRKPLAQRTVTVTMSLPRAAFSAFFSLFVLVWVFIFGIMIGRGHNPEEVVPDLARVMPSPKAPDAEQPRSETKVIQPSDLHYHESLKGKNAGDKPRAAPVTPAPQPKPAPAQPAPASTAAKPTPTATKPVSPKPAASASAQSKPASPKPAAPAQSKPASPKPATPVQSKPSPPAQQQKPAQPPAEAQDKTVYNYVYQVAAFNNTEAAETMRKKLQADKLSAKVVKGESNGVMWYRILVAYKGTPEDTRTLRDKLAKFGISHIILRGKAPEK